MSAVDKITYLKPILDIMSKKYPENRRVNIVCHGHSVPAGYFATPYVDTFSAYPHLLHKLIKERFPFAIVNVIVTGTGGEKSASGSRRFEEEVLNHKPDIITIDYGLNDRFIALKEAKAAWETMIQKALERNIKIILLTPTWDISYFSRNENWLKLIENTKQIRELAEKYEVGLADSFKVFGDYVKEEEDLVDLLSHGNHPSALGHELIAKELAKFFLAR